MPVKLHNQTGRPVSIALNSRSVLHLPPRATSAAVVDAEVNGNPKVQKLTALGVIAVMEAGEPEGEDRGPAGPRRPRTDAPQDRSPVRSSRERRTGP